MARRDNDAAGSFLVPHQKGNRRRGAGLVRKPYRSCGRAYDLSNCGGNAVGGIAVVVADDHAPPRVLAANHVARNGVRHDARVRKGEIFRDDAAPAVRAKLDRGNHE